MAEQSLEIIYQDEYYVVVNKPSGLLIHPTIIDRHDKRSAMQTLRNQLGKRVYIIHRLDKATSGVVVFALSSEAAKRCAEEFQRGEVMKTYVAVVRGYTEEHGVIDSPLDPVPDKIMGKWTKTVKTPKPALTKYIRLAKTELRVSVSRYPQSRYSLLEVCPQTGRMHQIRRHLRRIHHPIIGDSKHGDHRHNRYFRESWATPRMLLAATELVFIHPYRKTRVKVVARLDEVFTTLIKRLSWQNAIPESWMLASARPNQ